jgi:signal transduction histidine kinase
MSDLSDALRAQRIEIAGEVHDRIIPPLFAARMRLEALAARFCDTSADETSRLGEVGCSDLVQSVVFAELQQTNGLIELAISVSRQLLSDLVPKVTGKPHWDSQIRRALGNHEVAVYERGSAPWEQIEPETATTLTLIAEEAIRNAVRHGEPSRIEIEFGPMDDQGADRSALGSDAPKHYTMSINDDGKGFDPTATTDHHGLRLMQLRATAIGGSLVISSRPGGPTKVSVQWPLASHGNG